MDLQTSELLQQAGLSCYCCRPPKLLPIAPSSMLQKPRDLLTNPNPVYTVLKKPSEVPKSKSCAVAVVVPLITSLSVVGS